MGRGTTTLRDTIKEGIKAEKEAITYYTYLLLFIQDGNDRRSINHILNEEKDHLNILQKISKRMWNIRKTKVIW